MASSKGQVTLRGRFSKGSVVTLTRVAGAHVLRPEGGEDIETKTVGEKDGVSEVSFTSGVEVGARYFIHGLEDGSPIQLRATGKASDDDTGLTQPPIVADRLRLADGTWADEAPTKESPPGAFVGPGPGQHQVPDGQQQRSDTLRGSAHPVDPDEKTPKRRQEDVEEGTPQMSDTRPRELEDGTQVGGGGEATEVLVGPQRQEDVPDSVQQRSDTPAGTAVPIPAGNAVHAQEVRESSFAKETRGEPGRAAAEPIEIKGAKVGHPDGATKKESEKRHEEITASDKAAASTPAEPAKADGTAGPGVNTSGLDAQGQPVSPDVAAAAGVEPAKKAAEAPAARSASGKDPKRVAAAKKAAATRKKSSGSSKKK
jgi:hypothetical protein